MVGKSPTESTRQTVKTSISCFWSDSFSQVHGKTENSFLSHANLLESRWQRAWLRVAQLLDRDRLTRSSLILELPTQTAWFTDAEHSLFFVLLSIASSRAIRGLVTRSSPRATY